MTAIDLVAKENGGRAWRRGRILMSEVAAANFYAPRNHYLGTPRSRSLRAFKSLIQALRVRE